MNLVMTCDSLVDCAAKQVVLAVPLSAWLGILAALLVVLVVLRLRKGKQS